MNDKDIEKRILEEQDRIFFFNYGATVFYQSWAMTDFIDREIKKYGASCPFWLLYYPGKDLARIEMSLESWFGELIIKKLKNGGKKYFNELKKDLSRDVKDIEIWLSKHRLDGLRDCDLEKCCNLIQESEETLIEKALSLQIATVLDGHLMKEINHFLSIEKISILDNDLNTLTISDNLSQTAIHNNLVADFIYWMKKNKLNKKSFEEIIKNKKAKGYLNKCYQAGYFLYSGYSGVSFWSIKDEYNLIKKESKKNLKKEKKVTDLNKLRKKYSFSKELNFWFKVSRYFSFARDLRKTVQQKVFYFQANYLERIGEIVNIPRKELEYLRYDEIKPKILKNREEIKKVIKKRHNGYLWIWLRGIGTLLWEGKEAGKKYKKFSLWVKKTSFQNKNIKEFKGQPVMLGKTKGVVKIIFNPKKKINLPKDFILVTGNTHPDFVPLMKKAKAIVTEVGGITSHAAIISRELRTPCIIGTKIATKVLKDGDLVEVNANRGIVKVLKKA